MSAPFGAPPGVGVRRYQLAGAGIANGWPWLPQFSIEPFGAKQKIDPLLRDWLHSHLGPDTNEVLIEYSDPVDIPPFPIEAGGLSFVAGADSAALDEAHTMADSLMDIRAPWYRMERVRLRHDFGATVLDSFWLTRSVVARIALAHVNSLASRGDVEWISFAHRGGPPPAAACVSVPQLPPDDASVGEGRQLLGSDWFRDAGYASGRLSLLDTGVWTGHELFDGLTASPTPTGSSLLALDCTTGDCAGTDPNDVDVSYRGHGTTTCGILVANGSMTDCLEGVTRARLECHRVYIRDPDQPPSAPSSGKFDPAAYQHACEKLLVDRNAVAILEVAEHQSPDGALSHYAGRLYRAGIAVIAAAGNHYDASYPTKSWLGSPGDSRWVISVGARETRSPNTTPDDQARQRVGYRRKPDLQAPTVTSSAGVFSGQVDFLHQLNATSGATPYAGAAALILRNWMRAAGGDATPPMRPDPGQVYAAMLACGETTRTEKGDKGELEFPLTTGAGLLHLPATGRGWWGEVTVGSHAEKPIPVTVDLPSANRLRVAIWWPDPPSRKIPWTQLRIVRHADFDLELVDSNGGIRAKSEGTEGVFECIDYAPGTSVAGTWEVRVLGRSVGRRARPVYVAVVATP